MSSVQEHPSVGLVGLGPMGRGLAGNLAAQGVAVRGWDHAAVESGPAVQRMRSLEALVEALAPPRGVWLMVPAGAAVDETLQRLRPLLDPGDVVADCGNSHFRDTARREAELGREGIGYLGVGVSGGPEGARRGPAIMAGGDAGAWARWSRLFEAVAAKVDGEPCCAYLGPGGAGHFAKMVHNGIEYAVMHLLLETFAVLRQEGRALEPIAATFRALDRGPTGGFLTRITAEVLEATDAEDGAPLIDRVDPAAKQKGTGRWTVQAALELDVAVPTLAEAVMARSLSGGGAALRTARPPAWPPADPDTHGAVAPLLPDALALAFASAFLQGLRLCAAAEPALGQPLDPAAVLRTWRRGCILQGGMVEALLRETPAGADGQALPGARTLSALFDRGAEPLGRLVAAAAAGLGGAGLASALSYAAAVLGHPLPTGLLQLQRDRFGGHGLEALQTGAVLRAPWHRDETP